MQEEAARCPVCKRTAGAGGVRWAEENVSPNCVTMIEKTEPVIRFCWEWILFIADTLSQWCNIIRVPGEKVIKTIVNLVAYFGPGFQGILKIVLTFLCNIAATLILMFCRWSYKFGSLVSGWMRNIIYPWAEKIFLHFCAAIAKMAVSIILLCLKGIIIIADYAVPWYKDINFLGLETETLINWEYSGT